VQRAAAQIFAFPPPRWGCPAKPVQELVHGPAADNPVRVGNWGTPLIRGQRKPRNTDKQLCKVGSPEPCCTERQAAMGMGLQTQPKSGSSMQQTILTQTKSFSKLSFVSTFYNRKLKELTALKSSGLEADKREKHC